MSVKRVLITLLRAALAKKRSGLLIGQEGTTLPFTIILMTVGVLIVVPLLSYLSVLYQAYRVEREQTLMRLAADAAVNRVVGDLRRGADGVATTYVVEQPHQANQPYQTFTVNTTYWPASVSVNDFTTVITVAIPTVATIPAATQQYVDPGTASPQFAVLQDNYAYLVRLFQVKAGTLQVNWAYQPAGISRVGIWAGFPVDNATQQPFAPGLITRWPSEHPILDTGFTPANVTHNRTEAITVAPGVYTIVFDNTLGVGTKTTMPFAPSGGLDDTWVYVTAYRDYVVTATAEDVTVSAYVRQIPGYSQPPVGDWSPTNPAWIDNKVYIYSWNPP